MHGGSAPTIGSSRSFNFVIDVDPTNIVAPFPVKRVYWIYNTSPGATRGRHAHRALRQLLVACAGSCTIMLDDGKVTRQIHLDRPTKGLLVGPGIWREMNTFSKDCVLVVLASLPYDEADYIRDYLEFKQGL